MNRYLLAFYIQLQISVTRHICTTESPLTQKQFRVYIVKMTRRHSLPDKHKIIFFLSSSSVLLPNYIKHMRMTFVNTHLTFTHIVSWMIVFLQGVYHFLLRLPHKWLNYNINNRQTDHFKCHKIIRKVENIFCSFLNMSIFT